MMNIAYKKSFLLVYFLYKADMINLKIVESKNR